MKKGTDVSLRPFVLFDLSESLITKSAGDDWTVLVQKHLVEERRKSEANEFVGL